MNGVGTATVLHVDIGAPPRTLAAEPGTDGLLAVFWDGDLPLGSRIFTAGELPVPASAVPAVMAAAVAPALALRARTAEPPRPAGTALPGPSRSVSVIVCTGGRAEDLARCLDSLALCAPAPDEIIVVDNSGGDPATAEVAASRPGLRYVAEPRRGLSRARNAGIAAATGDILAFTDDDVIVTPTWLAPIVAGFDDPEVVSVTGLVLPTRLDTPSAAAFELNYGGLAGSFLPARYDRNLLRQGFGEAPPVWKVGAGANMAFRRTALVAAGPFDERLGAGAAGCSEDSEMMYRLLLNDGVCRFDPAAVVFHRHRDSLPALRRQLRAYLRGHVAALFVQFGHDHAPGNLIRAFIGLPVWLCGATVMSFWHREPMRRRLLPWEMLGVAEGWLAVLRYRRPRAAATLTPEESP